MKKCAFFWFLLHMCTTMHGSKTVKARELFLSSFFEKRNLKTMYRVELNMFGTYFYTEYGD